MAREFGEIRNKDIEWRTAILNGKRVAYQETTSNPPTEAPLVMIPGWPVSSNMLEPLMQELGENVQCYALNLPGFGGSETDNRTNHTFSYYADFLNKFRAGVVHSERISLLGYSTGGVLGIVYSNNFQDSLDKLIVFSPPHDGPEHYKLSQDKELRFSYLFVLLKRYRTLALPLNRRIIRERLIDSIISDMYLDRYPKLFHSDSGFIEELVRQTSKLNVKAAVDLAAALVDHDFSNEASRVRTRTLVISAENDEAVSPERTKRLSELIPGSKFVVIPDSDHAVGIAEPEKIAPLIAEFLRT